MRSRRALRESRNGVTADGSKAARKGQSEGVEDGRGVFVGKKEARMLRLDFKNKPHGPSSRVKNFGW